MGNPRRLDHLRKLMRFVSIRSKSMDVIPLDLDSDFAWAQKQVIEEVIRQYNAGKPVRIIIDKARQLGLSTVSAAAIFNWILMFPGASALIIAHDTETTQSLFEKIQDAWEWWPFKGLLHLRHASARRLTVEETGSTVRIATARNVKSGRGRTIQAMHLSEMSLWDDPETLMTGLSKTVPNQHGTIVIIECTANGVGNLYWQMWTDAVAGESDYVPLFFPWWQHPEYVAAVTNLTYTDLDEYERWLVDELGLSFERIEWRRWAIKNECHGDPQDFQQEYPATAAESFLKKGRNVFPPLDLQACYEPRKGVRGYLIREGFDLTFRKDPLGELTVFVWPDPDKERGDYQVACDPSRTVTGDPACIQVLNRRTYEQVAVWHGHCDPVTIADRIIELGRYYDDAEVCSEIEGPGYGTIAALIAKGYPRIWQHRWADKHQGKVGQNFGWSTNYQRKNWMVGQTTKLLHDRTLTIHDPLTYEQLQAYSVISVFGEMGPPTKDGCDDAVMAFCQVVITAITEPVPDAYVTPAHGIRRREPQPTADIGGMPPWAAFEEIAN